MSLSRLALLAVLAGCGSRAFDPLQNPLAHARGTDAAIPDAAPPDTTIHADAAHPDARPPDAAVDARPPDAAVDARPPDAAVDARPPDAAVDARPPDAFVVDAPPPDAFVPPVSCTTDVTGIVSGSRVVPPLHDFVALCDGYVLLGDRVANQIVLENVVTGTVATRYQLSSAPHKLALDRQAGVLYATLYPATFIARVDLSTGIVSNVPVSPSPATIAVGPGGKIFAVYYSNFNTYILVLDGVTGTILQQVQAMISADNIAYENAEALLIAGASGSPGFLSRYVVDRTTGRLTFAETRMVFGGPCDLAISPFGGHLAFACGGGNTMGYNIADIAPANLSTVNGSWDVGPYPRAADFSPDGMLLATTNASTTAMTFSVANHSLLASYSIDQGNCLPAGGASQLGPVRFSRGGRLLYVYLACFDNTRGSMSWIVVP